MECECTVPTYIDGEDCGELLYILQIPMYKTYTCIECSETYRMSWCHIESIRWEGYIQTYYTCEHCYSLRQVFFSGGWYFTMLWEEMYTFINDAEGDISVSCILELTPKARGKVLDSIEEVWDGC